jgi:hypothetical protein
LLAACIRGKGGIALTEPNIIPSCVSLYAHTHTHTHTHTHIECSFCRLIRCPGSFLESLIGRQCGSPRQSEGHSVLRHKVLQKLPATVLFFCVFMARVRYNLVQRVFMYDCYVKTNSCKSCKRKFRSKFPDTCPSRETISKLVKKVRTH